MSTTAESNNTETPLEKVLENLFEQEHLKDITLRGTDGVEGRAQRCFLAARSHVMNGMLYGSFAGSHKGVVQTGYSGTVLIALVEYIYTNDAQVLRNGAVKQRSSQDDSLVGRRCDTLWFCRIVQQNRQICHGFGGERTKRYDEMLSVSNGSRRCGSSVDRVCRVVDWQLDYEGTLCTLENDAYSLVLSHCMLKALLKDDRLYFDELSRLRMLAKWAAAEAKSSEQSPYRYGATSNGVDPNATRRKIAMDLAIHFRLELIGPSYLSGKVTASVLVSDRQLREAYVKQGLATQEVYGVLFDGSCRQKNGDHCRAQHLNSSGDASTQTPQSNLLEAKSLSCLARRR